MAVRKLAHDWFSCPLPANVSLHVTAWLYSAHAFVHYHSRLPNAVKVGRETGLYHGTFFDLGPDAEIEIGEYCSLVGAIFATNGRVSIGDYTFIAHEVVVADNDWTIPCVKPIDSTCRTHPVRNEISIGRNVWIGSQATIIGNVHIGDNAIIGAGAVVTADVPDDSLCVGNPMKIVDATSRNRQQSAGWTQPIPAI